VAAFAGVALDADRADVGGLRELAGQLRAVVDDLKDLVPPPDAAAAHARLVGGMYDYARTLDAFITHRGGVVGYHQFLMEVGGTRALDWLQAYNALAAQGYVTAVLLRP
jgi:hypothetical protein